MAGRIPSFLRLSALAVLAAVAACSAPPPPPPPPPPPEPVQEPFRARPLSPNMAHEGLQVPGIDAMGVRQTVNTGLTPAQITWNVRSAFNVAALNCPGTTYAPLAERYGAFLKTHASELAATNRALDSEFRQKFGPAYKDVRDAYMTQVYNYFALPAVLPDFCPVALAASEELALAPKGELALATATVLPKMEQVFLEFFQEYDAYRAEAAAWDAEYLATYGEPYPYAPRSIVMNPLHPRVTIPADGTMPLAPIVPGAPAASQPDAVGDAGNQPTAQ